VRERVRPDTTPGPGVYELPDDSRTFSDASFPDPAKRLPSGEGELIHLQFLARARETPDAAAVTFDGAAISYGELERRSRRLAGRLAAEGAGPSSRVAILARRGPELIWSMIAVARLGGVFIVLDVAYPQARLETLAAICVPEFFVRAGIDPASAAALAAGRPLLDAEQPRIATDPRFLDATSPEDPAYFLFTSGSTGAPKCVACTHRPLSRFVAWHIETFGLSPSDRFTMLSGLSHDPLMRDIFTPLSLGATLAIPKQSDITEPGALAPWFEKAGATVAHLTPAMGQLLTAGGSRIHHLPKLRRLFWGGDRLPPTRIAEVARLAPRALHTNFYGSTETPQAAGYFPYDGGDWSPWLPVGKGTHGFQVLVVDDAKRPIWSGEEGEIAVRSNYLSAGYVTEGRIQPPDDRGTDPQGEASIYYTGDRGRYLPDGNVMILGRADDQVKVRGYRVDLSEVTAALAAHPSVAEALAVASGEGADLRIVAFVAGRGRAPSPQALSRSLAERLPSYMLPHEVRTLGSLPLLANGKVDRRALQALAAEAPAAPAHTDAAPHANGAEGELIEAWSGLFPASRVTRDTTFAGLGGDSLSYVQAYLATEEVLGVVPGGWQEMSVARLAAQRADPSRVWTVIDTPMLIRAAAIVLVVAGHLQLIKYGDGATTALFLVSGFLFGGLQLREAFRQASPVPILRSFRNIFIPTFLYALFSFAQKSLRGHQTTVNIVLMNNDFVDYSALPPGAKAQDYQIHLWYVDALLKMLLFLSFALVLARWTKLLRMGVFRFAMALFALGCLTRFILPGFFDPQFFANGARVLSIWEYAPTTHFATFMLGVLVANAADRRAKWFVGATMLVYAAVSAHFFGLENAVVAAVAGVVLIAASRVPVPKPLAKLAFLLSGASLFIYLTHYMFGSATRHVLGEGWQAVEVLAGLAGGIVVWRCWTWVLKQAGRLVPRAAIAESGAAA
jgi:amino acid adenylation domain-containing protein